MQEQRIVSKCVADEIYKLVGKEDDKLKAEFLEDEEIVNRLIAIKLSLSNYNKIIEQNVNLQTELNLLKDKIKDIKKKPFFPYALNSEQNMDFGEFYLISHAWFTIPNLHEQLGIVEVEWKSSGVRKTYLGKGDSNGTNFKADVLSIALHGQKIKDSSEVQ